MMKTVGIVLISVILLCSCVGPTLINLDVLEQESANYENPKEFDADGYHKVLAIVEVDRAELDNARRTGASKFEKVIAGVVYFSRESTIEVDCGDGTKEWAPVLFRYKVKE